MDNYQSYIADLVEKFRVELTTGINMLETQNTDKTKHKCEISKCKICACFYNDSNFRPIITKCGHMLCEMCLHKLKHTSSCPTCRTYVDFSDPIIMYDFMSNLPPKYIEIDQIDDELKLKSEQLANIETQCKEKQDYLDKIDQTINLYEKEYNDINKLRLLESKVHEYTGLCDFIKQTEYLDKKIIDAKQQLGILDDIIKLEDIKNKLEKENKNREEGLQKLELANYNEVMKYLNHAKKHYVVDVSKNVAQIDINAHVQLPTVMNDYYTIYYFTDVVADENKKPLNLSSVIIEKKDKFMHVHVGFAGEQPYEDIIPIKCNSPDFVIKTYIKS